VKTYAQIGPEKPIKDAKEEVVLEVEEGMLKLGKPNDPLRCVLAIAARKTLRDRKLKSVQILRTRSYLEFDREVLRFANDHLTVAMITVYDLSGKFVAGEYRLLPVPDSATFSAQAEARKEAKANPKTDKKKRIARSKRMRPRGEHRVAWMQSAPKEEAK
jgi:hypothetical protein